MPLPSSRPLLAATAALVLAGALTSCTGQEEVAADDGDAPVAGSLTEADSPLAKELGGVDWLLDAEAVDETQTWRDIEEQTAACMARAGFDYVPRTRAATEAAPDPMAGLSDLERAEQYGYGITTGDDSAAQAGEVDPNAATVAQMSPAEREAWYLALNGWYEGEDGEVQAEDPEDGGRAGCSNQANDEVRAAQATARADSPPIYQDPRFSELVAGILMLDDDLEVARVRADLESAWSGCMAEAGFPGLAAPWAAQEAIMAEASEAAGDAGDADLREREIAMATADLTCQQDLDWEQTRLRARFAAEERFISDHRSDIDALSAALAEREVAQSAPAATE